MSEPNTEGNPDMTNARLLSVDKVVTRVVMLGLTGALIWAGSTLMTLDKSVVALSTNQVHLVESLAELKEQFREVRQDHELQLVIMDRMKVDDEREEMDKQRFRDHDKRITVLESK